MSLPMTASSPFADDAGLDVDEAAAGLSIGTGALCGRLVSAFAPLQAANIIVAIAIEANLFTWLSP